MEDLPIDAERVSLADAQAWPYQRSVAVNLDPDPAPERLVVASDVTVDGAGAPMWEDGHRWAAYVVDAPEPGRADSSRTLLYGAFVPMGRADVAVQDAHDGQEVMVLERAPSRVVVHTVRYDGPGRARPVSGSYYWPQTWVPFL